MAAKKTRKDYENYLNEIDMRSVSFIIGGKFRRVYEYQGKYGTALRKYDPIAFEVGLNDWERENKNNV
jgi:hypothetical protein